MKQSQRVEKVRTQQRVSYIDAGAKVQSNTRYSQSSTFTCLFPSASVPSVRSSSSLLLSVLHIVSVGYQTDPLGVSTPIMELQSAASLISDSTVIQSDLSMVLKV